MRKYWIACVAAIALAALCAMIFWPKGGRVRVKRAPAAEEASETAHSIEASTAPRAVEPSFPDRALVEAPSVEPVASVSAIDPEVDSEPDQTAVEKAQVARLPVIYAIRGDYPNDQARFDAMREALHNSGPSTETWTGAARSTFERWSSALEGIDRTLDSSSFRCYVAGCEMLVTFPDRATFEQGSAKFRGIRDEIPMGRVQTPGVPLADGRVQVSWMLMRPDVAPPDAR